MARGTWWKCVGRVISPEAHAFLAANAVRGESAPAFDIDATAEKGLRGMCPAADPAPILDEQCRDGHVLRSVFHVVVQLRRAMSCAWRLCPR